ncbi:uncharacterized protein LOC135400436 [Ornithodoros turicata]|uniref:uncharacterized protein LOC135400436 n=1 Tax=Ornithodoros turicata TaxID=34597 RepID=UPI003138C85B
MLSAESSLGQSSTPGVAVALTHCQPPEQFNFSFPEEWPKWIRRLGRCRVVSGLNLKPHEEQVNALIYVMGDKAEDVLLSLTLSEADMTIYETVVAAFDKHFVVKRNITYERAKFRSQKEGEPVEEFITDLHALAEHCKFGSLRDELIRDRIVVGVKYRVLPEKMQLNPDLTLEKATTMARQTETVKKQQASMQLGPENKVQRVKSSKLLVQKSAAGHAHKSATNNGRTGHSANSRSGNFCRKCGRSPHRRDSCPARNAKCNNCNKMGHYSRVCLSAAAVRVVSEEPAFLGTINVEGPKRWLAPINLCGATLDFKADTGADVTVVSEETYHTHLSTIPLNKPSRILKGPNRSKLQVLSVIKAELEYRLKKLSTDVFVIRGLEEPLLSNEALGLVKRLFEVTAIESATESSLQPVREFPKLFQGLGCVKIPYHARLKPYAVPFALSAPRRVPLPLIETIKKEIDHMVAQGVIVPVDEPTEWCCGMVIVKKPNGTYRICVDYTPLNKFVERELHPMPVTDHAIAQIGVSKYFSKLDANSGYWQFQLTEESQLLTTFITPFGRFKFTRLPFRISSAPEFFQKKMAHTVFGLNGVVCNMDDILVHAKTREEHDDRVRKVLARLQDYGVTLSKDKCVFGVQRAKFLGHIIDEEGIHPDDTKVKAIQDMKPPTSLTELKSFLGMVNYLGKFIPHLADILQPDGTYRPVAYASRSLTDTEKKYAQIEKEGLAIVWACDKFRDYITGMHITIETDHKPLIPTFMNKPLDDITPRLQRMKLKLMRHSCDLVHVPGKSVRIMSEARCRTWKAVGYQRLSQIKKAQYEDTSCQMLSNYLQQGRPDKALVDSSCKNYW